MSRAEVSPKLLIVSTPSTPGKRHLDLVHPDLEFIPEGGGVVDVVVKFHKDNDHAGRHP